MRRRRSGPQAWWCTRCEGEPGNQKLTEPGDEVLVAGVLTGRSMPLVAPDGR